MQYPLQFQLVLKYCCCFGEMTIWNLRARVNLDSDLQMQKMHYLDSFSPCLLQQACSVMHIVFLVWFLTLEVSAAKGKLWQTNKTVPGLGSAGAPTPESAIFSSRPVTAVHSLSSHGALSWDTQGARGAGTPDFFAGRLASRQGFGQEATSLHSSPVEVSIFSVLDCQG